MFVDNDKLKYYERYYFANSEPVPFKLKDNDYIIHMAFDPEAFRVKGNDAADALLRLKYHNGWSLKA